MQMANMRFIISCQYISLHHTAKLIQITKK